MRGGVEVTKRRGAGDKTDVAGKKNGLVPNWQEALKWPRRGMQEFRTTE